MFMGKSINKREHNVSLINRTIVMTLVNVSYNQLLSVRNTSFSLVFWMRELVWNELLFNTSTCTRCSMLYSVCGLDAFHCT